MFFFRLVKNFSNPRLAQATTLCYRFIGYGYVSLRYQYACGSNSYASTYPNPFANLYYDAGPADADAGAH